MATMEEEEEEERGGDAVPVHGHAEVSGELTGEVQAVVRMKMVQSVHYQVSR